jgi:hypothetical protein
MPMSEARVSQIHFSKNGWVHEFGRVRLWYDIAGWCMRKDSSVIR